jgi:hypothetical protein
VQARRRRERSPADRSHVIAENLECVKKLTRHTSGAVVGRVWRFVAAACV